MRTLPPLSQLRVFEAVARHMSFKLAAAELGVTPTAVSHRINLLEHYCGQPLFRRRPRPIALTWAADRSRRTELAAMASRRRQTASVGARPRKPGEPHVSRGTACHRGCRRWTGVAICSDVLVASKPASGALHTVSTVTLPGYGFYMVHRDGHPRRASILAFLDWLTSETSAPV